jgi:hypothetical protein
LAKREHPEKWYQQKWCEAQKGPVEVVLPDGSLINHLTIQPINYLTLMKSGDCSNIGNNERQKILDSAEHHH